MLQRDVQETEVPFDLIKLAFWNAVKACVKEKRLPKQYEFPKYGIRIEHQPARSLCLRKADAKVHDADLYRVSFHVTN